MSSPIGVAVVGGGIFIKTQHLPAVLKTPHLSLKAIYSRSLSSAQETSSLISSSSSSPSPSPSLYASDASPGNDFDDLLLRDDIQALIIALPILVQPQFVEKALSAGKHVLAEKPIAKDVSSAKALIQTAKSHFQTNGATLSVAENYRFYPSFAYAAQQASSLGPATHFSVRATSMIEAETNKWYKTSWRQKPEYQGGFLLDGGVHFAAATRLLLGRGESSALEVRAVTKQIQEHLPPIDSVSAVVTTKAGGSGVYQVSVGSHSSAFEWDFAYRGGSVKVEGETVTVKPSGGEAVVKVFERTSGVSEEVDAWARGLVEGVQNPLQSPEEALADVEFMEKMFVSGEREGAVVKYEEQE